MAKVSIFGQKDLFIQDTLSKETGRALENGYQSKIKAKYMWVSIQMIISTELVNMFGKMDVFIKETLKWIKSKFFLIQIRDGQLAIC